MDSPRDDGLPATCPEVFWGHHTQWGGILDSYNASKRAKKLTGCQVANFQKALWF